MSSRRRYSKRELLGSLHVDYVMSVSELGLVPGTNRWQVLRAFLNRGEGSAERLVEARDGFLILQSISRPAECWRNLHLQGPARRIFLAQVVVESSKLVVVALYVEDGSESTRPLEWARADEGVLCDLISC